MEEAGVKMTDYIFAHSEGAYRGFLDDLKNTEDETLTELFFHPAYLDNELSK